jgi:hypothetical protein
METVIHLVNRAASDRATMKALRANPGKMRRVLRLTDAQLRALHSADRLSDARPATAAKPKKTAPKTPQKNPAMATQPSPMPATPAPCASAETPDGCGCPCAPAILAMTSEVSINAQVALAAITALSHIA